MSRPHSGQGCQGWPPQSRAVTIITGGVTLGISLNPLPAATVTTLVSCGAAEPASQVGIRDSWYQRYGMPHDTIHLAVAHNPPSDGCASAPSRAYFAGGHNRATISLHARCPVRNAQQVRE